MKHSEDRLVTPIYLKMQAKMPWPDDTFFYVLTADGLFACRNHKFFRSCVRAPHWPSELARQEPFLNVSYPKMSRRMIERIVGFFSVAADVYGSEAGVLLAWSEPQKRIHVVVPEQVATVNRNRWGDTFPIGLKYETPDDLPADWVILGDAHSHVDYWPTPSYVDDLDETHRAGVHIVVGKIYSEPPEFHVEAVVDGKRFTLRPEHVMKGYRRRDTDVPREWLEKVKIKASGSYYEENRSGESSGAKLQGEPGTGGNGSEGDKSFSTEPDAYDDPQTNATGVTLGQLPEPDQFPGSRAPSTRKEPRNGET